MARKPSSTSGNPAQISATAANASEKATSSDGQVLWSAFPPLRDLADIPAQFRASTTFVRTKYRHLYELPVVEHANGSRSFHHGRLYRCHGLNVLFLSGDFVEMAFQHGRLLADQIPQGTLPQSAKLVRNAIANAFGRRPWFQQRLMDYIEGFLVRRMFVASSKLISRAVRNDFTLLESIALCDAEGLSVGDLIHSLFNPEILLILAKHSGGTRRSKEGPIEGACVPPASCCSSFAAWGSHTIDGNLLIGHNIDYPLNGYYDRFLTVIYFVPTVPSRRYMSFVSAGVQSAGITAYNDAGPVRVLICAPQGGLNQLQCVCHTGCPRFPTCTEQPEGGLSSVSFLFLDAMEMSP